MTFKQAKAKLKKLADGKYHSVSYVLTEGQQGQLVQECGLYIDGLNDHFISSTWNGAFTLLETRLNPPEIKEIEDIPEIEVNHDT